jgi:hypothetical protein
MRFGTQTATHVMPGRFPDQLGAPAPLMALHQFLRLPHRGLMDSAQLLTMLSIVRSPDRVSYTLRQEY